MENIEWVRILKIIAVIGGIATVFGLFLAPMFYLGSKIDNLICDIKGKRDK